MRIQCRRNPRIRSLHLGALLSVCAVVFAPLDRPAAKGQDEATREDQGPRDSANPAREEFLKINFSFNRGLYSIVIPRYEKLLREHPRFEDRATVQYALALCHSHLAAKQSATGAEPGPARAHHEKAVRALKSALAGPGLPAAQHLEARDLLAQSLLAVGDHDGAAEAYGWILEHAKGTERALASIGLADTEYARGRYEDAAGAYSRAIEGLPEGVDPAVRRRAGFQLAMSLYQQGGEEIARSIPMFEGLSSQRGEIGDDALHMAAVANQKTGRLDAAETQYRRLSALEDPTRREGGLWGLGAVLFLRGDHAAAADRLETFLELHPQSVHASSASLYHARSLLELEKLRSAGKILLSLIDNREVGEEAGLWLARAYASVKKHDSAIKVLRRTIRRHPQGRHRQLLEVELATELIAAGEFDQARTALAGIDAAGESADRALYLRAFTQHRAKDYDASAKTCVSFLQKHPESSLVDDVGRLVAENHFLLGRFDDSIEAYRKLLASKSAAGEGGDRLLPRYRIAEALFFGKRYEEAARAFEALAGGKLDAPLRSEMRENPVYESYHYLLGESLYQLRRHASAIVELDAYLRSAATPKRYGSDARFKLAHAHQLAGNIGKARAAYREALEKDPQTRHAEQIRFELGQTFFEAGDFAPAQAAFEELVVNHPDSRFAPFAMRFLGWICQKEDRHDQAIVWLQKVVDGDGKHPVHGEALYLLSVSLGVKGDFPRAREALARLRTEHPDDPRIREALLEEAIAFSREGKDTEALARLEKLRVGELPAELAVRAWYEKAWTLRRLDRPDDAIGSYRKLLALGAGGELVATATLELAELEFDRENYDEARRLLTPLVTAKSAVREQALYQLCWCSYRLDDEKNLEASFGSLLADYPSSEHVVQIALLSARKLLDRRRFDDAAERFRIILDIDPPPQEAEQALVGHAECLNETRRFEDAIRELDAFRKAYPKSRYATRARFALGWANENLARLDAAQEHYRVAAKDRTPTAARAQFQLGQCQVARKKHEDAIIEFLHVTGRFGNYPQWSSRALLQVAGCLTLLEKYDKAREYYREVVERFDGRDEARLAKEKLARLPR